jgi:restriction endonuclease S subunit
MSTTYRLADLVDLLRGRVPANTVSEPEGPRFFGIAEITARGHAAPRYVEYDPDVVDDAVVLQDGDIAMSLMSNIGDAALIDTSSEGAVLGRECVALRVTRPNVILPAWLSAWTASEEFKSQVALHTTGTTMARLGLKPLSGFTITVPAIETQRPVEGLVRRFDRAIATTTATLTDLQHLRDAEIQLALANTRERS